MKMQSAGLLGFVSLLAACGSTAPEPTTSSGSDAPATGDAPPAAAPVDTSTPASTPPLPTVDNGAPSETYPAFPVDVGQLVNNGGHVLTKPVIVTVSWTGDANADAYEAFGDAIGGTSYWKSITSEYGVGAAVSGAANHVRMTTPAPTTFSDSAIDQFVADKVANAATSGWPAATNQTVYIMYLPPEVSLELDGSDACQQGVGGYHTSTRVNGADVAYAVVPQCDSDFEMTTASASHELGEAALDPHPQDNAGWTGFDDDHLSFEFFQQLQSENGDACEFFYDVYLQSKEPSFPYVVQRQWSNASAKAGHNPCVPAPAATYFNVTPLNSTAVGIDLTRFGGSPKAKTHGFPAKVGETIDIELGFFSDAPKEAWTIAAHEGNPLLSGKPQNPRLELSLDKTSGRNGEKAHLKVNVKSAGKSGVELVTLEADDGKMKHFMPLLIGSM